MISWFSGLLGCLRGQHQRSERHVHLAGNDYYVSVCRYCRTPMWRRAKRDWVPMRLLPPPDTKTPESGLKS